MGKPTAFIETVGNLNCSAFRSQVRILAWRQGPYLRRNGVFMLVCNVARVWHAGCVNGGRSRCRHTESVVLPSRATGKGNGLTSLAVSSFSFSEPGGFVPVRVE